MVNKEPDEFRIFDDTKQIVLSLYGFKDVENYEDGDDCVVVYDVNQIEMHFRQDDGDFWGAGGGDYLSTRDIWNMGKCIRNVIFDKKNSDEYTCQQDLFRIALSHEQDSNSYTFTASMMNLLGRREHITVTKTGLTREALDEYIAPFLIWPKYMPVFYGDGRLVERYRKGSCSDEAE